MGDDIGKGNANCGDCGSQWDGVSTSPVGSFAPNGFGLYDMMGNAWQWVDDKMHDSYLGAPTDGSPWTTGESTGHILRGGAFSFLPLYDRVAIRFGDEPASRAYYFGFRVAETLQ
ncbi:MAG: formylglycine-generating enzyme family protein [Nitrosomonadales bacterium]